MNAPGRRPRRRCRRRSGAVSLVALMVPFAACSDDGGGSDVTPEEVLAAAG